MSDLISRQAAIDAMEQAKEQYFDRRVIIGKMQDIVSNLPSAQSDQNNDSEFWRKRADYYSDVCMKLIGEMGKGVKIVSVKISANGIEFIKELPPEQPERKRGKWIDAQYPFSVCSECGAYFDTVNNQANYCPVCGADMRGDSDEA